MDYQIILLPQKSYWKWVGACREYVLAYGANLTDDPVTAGNYMMPQQVITFPDIPDAYQEDDLETWFEENYPGVRLDPVPAGKPSELAKALKVRVDKQDRYGQKQKPFYLLWPTDYPVITQKFGANPQIYMRFGMPGHEGLDIRALTNTHVYCCAEGSVYEVHTNPKDHPYGIHVRVRHKDGYKTVYGHLARALVRVGEEVKAGQVIGMADSTGASTAAHLHLTLKRDGASIRKETKFPKDVIDPTPFMVWPDGTLKKTIEVPNWAAGRCLVGAHGRASGAMQPEDIELVTQAKLEAVKVNLGEREATVRRLVGPETGLFVMARVARDLSGDPVPAREFVEAVLSGVGDLYQLGVRFFELGEHPNVQTAGFGRSWKDGREYAVWLIAVMEAIRNEYPDAMLGYPGLMGGEDLLGWRGEALRFLEESQSAAMLADWVGVSCHWDGAASSRLAPFGQRWISTYKSFFPEKLLFVTEFCNTSSGLAPALKARQYVEFFRDLRPEPMVGAAFAFALSAPDGHDGMIWRREDSGDTGIAEVVGRRGF